MNYGIILLGGNSLRTFSSIPKQYILVKNKEIYIYSFEIFLKNPKIDKIILVASKVYVDIVKLKIKELDINKPVYVIAGGETRQESSFSALNFINKNEPNTKEINVFIHDSARPLLTTKVLNRCIESMKNNIASTTFLPVSEAVCSFYSSNIVSYIDRNKTAIIQTPQSFHFETIYEAHTNAINNGVINANDDAILVRENNIDVSLVLGDKFNFKITNMDDLMIFRKIMGE